jgi:hypothetical protein
MKNNRRTSWVVLGFALSGCAGGDGGGPATAPTPSRPEVVFEDEVGAIDAKRLAGRWDCRELNPFTGRPPATNTVTYDADGTARSQGLLDLTEQGVPVGGRMTVNFTYGWRVEGERVVASDIRSEIKAADGNAATGFMAGLTQMAANTFANRGKPGTVNVLRLNDRELVMRDTETPQAPLIGCTRAARAAT